ncbi:integrase core domain-containing protein [Corynebacterium marquesiae]|uniref:integrase core domain-containing protein n=1 Tax=Corynebacterium marquesiae TaxID=2913503 RepID=UPI003D73D27A
MLGRHLIGARSHQTLQKALHTRPFAHNIAELNQQLDDIIDYYNNHRPHRALNRRAWPPESRHVGG